MNKTHANTVSETSQLMLLLTLSLQKEKIFTSAIDKKIFIIVNFHFF